MDFEKLFNDLLNSEELDDFMKYVNKEKKTYMMKDFPNDEYYFLKLSDESKNLLDWLIDEVGLLDAYLFTPEEIETHEFWKKVLDKLKAPWYNKDKIRERKCKNEKSTRIKKFQKILDKLKNKWYNKNTIRNQKGID